MGLLRAEWKKATGNRLLAGFTVWIVPIGLAAFFALTLLVSLVSEQSAQAMAATSSGQWTTDMMGIWSFVTAFPGNVFGRLLALAFMSVQLAGEYQWGTWRFVLQRSPRGRVLIAKAAASTALVTLSYLTSSLVIGLGQTLAHRVVAQEYGPSLNASSLLEFAGSYAEQLSLGLLSLLILAGFAALGAVLTRSILGGLLAGFGLSVVEPMSRVVLMALSQLLEAPGLANLYGLAATFHLENARAWFATGAPLAEPIPGFTLQPALASSLIVLVAWAVGLLGAAVLIFQRQDITS